jgi:hypothetical protein
VFDVRSKVSRPLSAAEILQLDGHSHSTAFYRPDDGPSMVQTGQSEGQRAPARIINILIHSSC